MRASSSEKEVSGKVILGYISPSRVEVQIKIPIRNPDFLLHLTKSTGIGNRFDLRKYRLSLNTRKDKGAKEVLAPEFAAVDNCRA